MTTRISARRSPRKAVDTWHPWERDRLAEFARSEETVRSIPYGSEVPDVAGFLRPVDPPPWLAEQVPARRLYALAALPDRDGPAFLVVLPQVSRSLPDGALVLLRSLRKRVVVEPGRAVGDLVLEGTERPAPASWEILAPPRVGPVDTASAIAELSDQWRLSEEFVRSLLLGVVGAPPWHGRPPGIDLFLEVEGWTVGEHRELTDALSELVPPLIRAGRARSGTPRTVEISSGARVGLRTSFRVLPHSFRVIRLTADSLASRPENSRNPARSTLLYGPALVTEIPDLIRTVHVPLFVARSEAGGPPRSGIRVPLGLARLLWAAHWTYPEPPDTPDWYRWLRAERPRLDAAVESLLSQAPEPDRASVRAAFAAPDLADRLAQGALAHARLRGASAARPEDLGRVVDRWILSVEHLATGAKEGTGVWRRRTDRSAVQRSRRVAALAETVVRRAPHGLTPGEAIERLRQVNPELSVLEVELALEKLRTRGRLFEDRTGRYRGV